MGKISTLKKLLKGNKRQILVALYNNIVKTGITNCLSDELYLRLTYRIRFGKKLNLDNPLTFNEKLQWLKLHDRNPNYVRMVDKVAVKEYVSKIIGDEYIIPTLGVYNSFDEIDFNSLPNQFVLKCNHDSGSIVICRDKSTFDINQARKKLKKALKKDAFYWGREWPYKNVDRKILAEQYMEDSDSEELKDYKMMCFNGSVKCTFVGSERFSEDGLKITFFDTDWQKMPFERHYPRSKYPINKPLNFEEMVNLSEKLAKDIPFVRVDFYEIGGKTYFGELTFFPGSGWEEFIPSEWDKTLGNWIAIEGGYLLVVENVTIHIRCVNSDLRDYKLFCFSGVPYYCQVVSNRSKNECIDFYDMNWEHQAFVGLTPLVGNSGFEYAMPFNFELMKQFSARLSLSIPFCRIDFYEVNGLLFFGEITLYPAAGFGKFYPDEWNYILGNMIDI